MTHRRRAVFFADILGFSTMASAPGAVRARDALADVARLFKDDPLAGLLKGSWERRYGLSDSLVLLGKDPARAAAEAAQFCFSLAFYNSASQRGAVLVRGALTFGEVAEVEPLFPETGRANLVGEAIVRAVGLEKSGAKGPRLVVSEEVARRLDTWLLDRDAGAAELLWLLPPEPHKADPGMIGEVARAAVTLFLHHEGGRAGEHYLGYLDLVLRSLLRLRQRHRTVAERAIARAGLARAIPLLEARLATQTPEGKTLERIETALSGPLRRRPGASGSRRTGPRASR